MGCNCCELPRTSLNIVYQRSSGDGFDGGGSTAAAWVAAIAAIPDFDDGAEWSAHGGEGFDPDAISLICSSGLKSKSSGSAFAQAERFRYQWAFASASCYAQIWWEEFLSDYSNPYTPIGSPTAQDWTWVEDLSEGGLCLPPSFNGSDVTTYSRSDIFVLEPSEPADVAIDGENRLITQLRRQRYSWVAGYAPPTDGTFAGWPPP